MADRRSGEVERDDDGTFALPPCSDFQGTGMYCTECTWSLSSHERATEQGRDVLDERSGK